MTEVFARPATRFALLLMATVTSCVVVPRHISGASVHAVFHDDAAAQTALAAQVQAYVDSGVATSAFHTGSPRFDGEWAFGTFTMAALGLGQVALHHPGQTAKYLPTLEKCAEALTSAETNAFGTMAWGQSGLTGLPGGTGHAYLGYSNLSLSMLRLLDPKTRFARIHDDLTEALAERLSKAPHALVETYPGEAYPADTSLVAASIALHDCATGKPERPWWGTWKKTFLKWVDPQSGLIFQSGDAATGNPIGPPRASGTALVAFASSFIDKPLAAKLYHSLAHAKVDFLGYGGIREYAPGYEGSGDIDSGPVVLGVSVSATGFVLASAKLHDDFALFTDLYRTADFWGVPLQRPGGVRYLSGGPLGNAILLAMTSATWKWEKHCRNGAAQ